VGVNWRGGHKESTVQKVDATDMLKKSCSWKLQVRIYFKRIELPEGEQVVVLKI
jgi:hypothetical protein